jgi:hypothetical protein
MDMHLGELERMKSGRWLVVCYSQPGATRETVDWERIITEVTNPIEHLIQQNSVDFVLVITPAHSECPIAEVPAPIFYGSYGDIPPVNHRVAPSLLAISELWRDFPQFSDLSSRVIGVTDHLSLTEEKMIEDAKKFVPTQATLLHIIKIGESIPTTL